MKIMEAGATRAMRSIDSPQKLKEFIGDKHLVMYSRKDYSGHMDGRKKDFTAWPRLFVLRVKDGNIEYYSTISADMDHIWDMITAVEEPFERPRSFIFGDDVGTIEQRIFGLFSYNLKKRNTIFLADSFVPAQLKAELRSILNDGISYILKAEEIIKREPDEAKKYFYPSTRSIPKNALVYKFGDEHGVSYVLKGKRYIFEYKNLKEYYEMSIAGEDFSIDNWALSQGLYNRNFRVCRPGAEKIKEIHRLYELGIGAQKSFIEKFQDWHKTLSYACS